MLRLILLVEAHQLLVPGLQCQGLSITLQTARSLLMELLPQAWLGPELQHKELLRQSGADFFTAERLTAFERTRRAAKLRREKDGSFTLESDSPFGTITVMIQGRDVIAEAGRKAAQVVHRYGQDFTAVTLELGESRSGSFSLSEERKAA